MLRLDTFMKLFTLFIPVTIKITTYYFLLPFPLMKDIFRIITKLKSIAKQHTELPCNQQQPPYSAHPLSCNGNPLHEGGHRLLHTSLQIPASACASVITTSDWPGSFEAVIDWTHCIGTWVTGITKISGQVKGGGFFLLLDLSKIIIQML